MVNDENFGELLIQGLEEVAAHQRGELPDLKVVRRLRFGAPSEVEDQESPEEEEDDPDPRRRW